MTLVPASEVANQPTCYLPNHGVLREQSRTTKLRVVFNGSSLISTGISLNDILHSGPKLQPDISEVLLWIRQHRYIVVTDIVKMFRQIRVHPDDWDLQRIFWIESNQEVQSYRLTTVTYGLSCAPYLALRCLQQLVDDEGYRFPLAVPAMTKGRYVDDIFGGAETVTELQEEVNQLISLCMAGGFPLQKWSTNSPDLVFPLSEEENGQPSTIKMLGLCWQHSTDSFNFSTWLVPSKRITKRIVMSEVAQLFDPLGLLSPVLIRAKMFIQKLWLAKVNWDDSLSPEQQKRWCEFRQELPILEDIKSPRWLHTLSTAMSVVLHGFSNASNLAMAAVVYVRVVHASGTFITIASAKSKVAPLKPLTIPRLELTAALMLARLIAHVKRALGLSEVSIFLWTDSSITLTWISANPSRWKDYVRNRVNQIQEAIPEAFWRFVPGKENPADCTSRGLRAEQLKHHPLWWNGPAWLAQSCFEWTTTIVDPHPDADLEKMLGLSLVVSYIAQPITLDLMERYSSFTRLLRITAMCWPAVALFKKFPCPSSSTPLSPDELQSSVKFWMRTVQRSHFPSELANIEQGGTLPRSNPLNRLTPFVDREGLLRVGERL